MGPNGNVCSRTLESSVGPDVSTSAGWLLGGEYDMKWERRRTYWNLDLLSCPPTLMRWDGWPAWETGVFAVHLPTHLAQVTGRQKKGILGSCRCCGSGYCLLPVRQVCSRAAVKCGGCCIAWHACTDLSNGKKKIKRKEGRKERGANLEARSCSTVAYGNVTHHHWEGQGVRFLSCNCPDTEVCGPGGRQLCSRQSSGQFDY